MSPARVDAPRVASVVYCLGLLFTQTRDAVVLIKKARPDWQRGKFNGIGGHVEDGETPMMAMIREAGEEAQISGVSWHHFATMRGAAWTCYCYSGFDNGEAEASHGCICDGESVELVPLADLASKPLLPNLSWLIPLALDQEIRGVTTVAYCADKPTGTADADGPVPDNEQTLTPTGLVSHHREDEPR